MDAIQTGKKPGEGWLKWAAICGVVLLVALGASKLLSNPGDGIEVGKQLKLAATYKVDIDQGKGKAPISGRVFDFADRNLPRTSLTVPESDPRGARIVYLDTSLPAATLTKVIVNVEARKIEGVDYPAYSYPQFRYNTGTVEIQTIKPLVIPKR
jgi:hypothetical protein